MPAIVAGLALVFAVCYTNFVVPQLLGGGNYSTLAVQVYEQTIVVLDWTRGAVLATILLSTCFAFVLAIVAVGSRISALERAAPMSRRKRRCRLSTGSASLRSSRSRRSRCCCWSRRA